MMMAGFSAETLKPMVRPLMLDMDKEIAPMVNRTQGHPDHTYLLHIIPYLTSCALFLLLGNIATPRVARTGIQLVSAHWKPVHT